MKLLYGLLLAVVATQAQADANIIKIFAPITKAPHRETYQKIEYGDWIVKSEQCTAYSPDASTQPQGIPFTQTRSCTTDEERSVSQVTYYVDTQERATTAVLASESRNGQRTDSQSAVGAKEELGCKYSKDSNAYYWYASDGGRSNTLYWAGQLVYKNPYKLASPLQSVTVGSYTYTKGDTWSSSGTNPSNWKEYTSICRVRAS